MWNRPGSAQITHLVHEGEYMCHCELSRGASDTNIVEYGDAGP